MIWQLTLAIALLITCTLPNPSSAFWTVDDALSLQLAPPDKVGFFDSIPEKADEKVVISAPWLQAHWVIALVHSPYETTKMNLNQVLDTTLGIHSAREITTSMNVETKVHPHLPKEPLFGDGFNDFHVIGVRAALVREHRIETKPYNTNVRWWKSSSQSRWRIIDGMPLFGKPLSLIVVSRTDRSREWVWMHPGIPLPFTQMGDTKLVTDTEVSLIINLSKEVGGGAELRYFVPYTGYITNQVPGVMKAIRDAANNPGVYH